MPTQSGEDLIVDPKGHEAVAVSIHCPRFGRSGHVVLSHDQAAALAGALTAIVLEQGTARWGLAAE